MVHRDHDLEPEPLFSRLGAVRHFSSYLLHQTQTDLLLKEPRGSATSKDLSPFLSNILFNQVMDWSSSQNANDTNTAGSLLTRISLLAFFQVGPGARYPTQF